MYEVRITVVDANRRLDKFLFMYMKNAPSSLVYKLLRKKRIKLNGKRASGGELLADGDTIGMYLSQETISELRKAGEHSLPSQRELDIVFEDEHLLIVNKPIGIPSHGGMKGKDAHLLARVLYYLRKTGAYPHDATFTPALCNRLDVNTSGLVICGKNYQAIRAVNAAFANKGSIDKFYLAIVQGELHGSATLEGHYQKDTSTNTARISNHPDSPRAITVYKSISISQGQSLVQINPVTGRSHQIRAHMATIGHPLMGDKKYGGKAVPYNSGQLLHCYQLKLTKPFINYPTDTTWTAEPPENFIQIIKELNLCNPRKQL
ncbi:MAG: RluA family pseudouridine synthase [Defluviitaleaceae bacterium]|nr:RluA family pseudouridine synthase [Defluviitaleaceae bacterium]